MFANILTHLNKTSAQPDTAEEPMYGRLVPPTVPGWSYPSDEHLHRDEHLRRMEQPAIPPRHLVPFTSSRKRGRKNNRLSKSTSPGSRVCPDRRQTFCAPSGTATITWAG